MNQSRPNILCIAPTPALDHYVTVQELGIGEINRSIEVMERAGGKSINGARAILSLGGDPLVISALGGHKGKTIIDYAEKEGINLLAIETCEETRQYTEIWDATNHVSTHISEQWSKLTPQEWIAYCDLIAKQIEGSLKFKAAVISGGMPPGVGRKEVGELVRITTNAGIPCFIDSKGDTLGNLLAAKPTVVKINNFEAGDFLDMPIDSVEDAVKACNSIISRGVEACVITMGALGAVGVSKSEIYHLNYDKKGLWPVGSGDSFLAAMAVKWAQGQSWLDTIIAGVAAGTANAHHRISGFLDMEIYELGLKDVQYQQL